MDQSLQVFVTVAEKKSFSRAAEELHMTQPAVSQYIQAFEREMGARLLERSNKFVGLTKAGEMVYHHAIEILSLYEKMQRLVDDVTNKTSGPLAIGASYTFGEYILPKMMFKMMSEYPLVEPNIKIGNSKDIADMVHAHQLDVGIVEGNFNHHNLLIQPIAEDAMYIVMSPNHPLVKKQELLTPWDLDHATWIVREDGSGTREATEEMFKRVGLNPKQRMEFGSIQLIKESVEAGLGISLLSHSAIRKELELGSLHVALVQGLPYTRRFSIVTASPFQTKALETFINILLKEKFETDMPFG